ncbi:RagB/SusD family nutrient uptake outer membrane protein [Sinomicrobium weinanense]|uniref:RagB/SusD family nutrient uptake outer membrane protein n=1 Tax=Sinomicrobium weinanense TaxID=2842200 RepID=A0A926JNH4_9FLAO|nr:RagB/SusD family nutrient uptake outer membrane protein [Sinomicrobium weinanense]MBC9794464.1 RagB/SusD family nutrient uptake outer membrane protein [Sinomicrobium weinanense]MBU3124371.1 RagB/SusD family nutrient uptake outer membrane protein [Sinomicrobium weinanense]
MKKIFIAILAITAFSACDIDRDPYGALDAENVVNDPDANLESLINGMYAQLKVWSDPMHRLGEYAGDNMMIRGSSTDAFYEFISYSRTPNNYRLTQFWDYGYKAIAQASNIINMFEEGRDAEFDNKLGECYYVRGMMYFYLCRAFGRPYYQNPETNLGVPIVNGTPDDVINLELPDRATVKETYEQAIGDLKKAEELLTLDKGHIFASKEAAQAMLSRIYLYMSGTYEAPNTEFAQLSVEYADKVINSGKYSLLPREQFMKYNTFVPENNAETIFAVKRVASEFSGFDHYYGVGGMYANIGGMGWGEMYASAKYIDLLNETGRNDWRPDSYNMVDARAAFIEPTYEQNADTGEYTEVFRFVKQDGENVLNYVQAQTSRSGGTITCKDGDDSYTLTPVDAEQEIYSIQYKDGNTYTGVIDNYIALNRVYPQFYITKASREGEESHLHSPVISRLGEIYLNRAEAYAKLGNYSAALADLNTIRTRSIVDGAYSGLDASNASERIDKERQLELAYQAERSFDVFRNGVALTRHYPGPHKQFEDIPATDFRVIYYIPQDAINSYPGTLTQNPTQ